MSDDEDLIESEAPSPRVTEIRRRLDLLIPGMVSRKVMGGIAIVAIALGLLGGFLVGNAPDQDAAEQTSAETGPTPDGGYIPIVPDPVLEEPGIVVLSVDAGYLSVADLASVGETALPGGHALGPTSEPDRICGIAGGAETVLLPQAPGREYVVVGSASFLLANASLTEWISPDLDVLSASTLRARVELAQRCSSSDGLTVRTDGVQDGIGDEYAVFIVDRPDPVSGEIETSIVVLVRVGGQLIEISLTPQGGNAVPDGLNRALRIAEVAVTKMLAG